jgi:hypothetical protein
MDVASSAKAGKAAAHRDRRVAELRGLLREREGEVASLSRRLQAFESGTAMVAMGRRLLLAEAQAARATELESRLLGLEARLGRLRADKARLTRELEEVGAERDALERLWIEESEFLCDGDCEACNVGLAGRCVLCVGGRAPLLPHYRQLAERLGVRLIHHDGGREQGIALLPDLLEASDAVICPMDCVGPQAYYQLKRHCKQKRKPCVLTRNSGIAGFAAALRRIAQGRADIDAQT